MPYLGSVMAAISNRSFGRDLTQLFRSKVPFPPRLTTSARPGLSPFLLPCLEALADSFQVMMPRSDFVLRQVGFSQSLGQVAASTNFFVVRYQARDRLTVLQKHKRNVLIARAVNAVRKIARSFRHGYARFLHEADFRIIRFSWLCQQAGFRESAG